MIKIINGKKYSTETAIYQAESSSGCPGDLDYVRIQLYRKKTGEYFHLCEGGPRTCYGECDAYGSLTDGSRIIPLTLDEAKKWTETYCSGETYIQIFGDVEE